MGPLTCASKDLGGNQLEELPRHWYVLLPLRVPVGVQRRSDEAVLLPALRS